MAVLNAFELAYRPDLGIVTGRRLANSTLANTPAGYEMLLTSQCTRLSARWLLDIRRAPQPTIELANWIVYNWLPRAVAYVAPAPLRLAYLASPQRLHSIQTTPELHIAVNDLLAAVTTARTAIFRDESEAVEWLLDGPPT